jgi:hypothetical protein
MIKRNRSDCKHVKIITHHVGCIGASSRRENRVPRRIFGPKRNEVIGSWRNLHNEELHNLYCSPSIIRIMKSMEMRWAGHVARLG